MPLPFHRPTIILEEHGYRVQLGSQPDGNDPTDIESAYAALVLADNAAVSALTPDVYGHALDYPTDLLERAARLLRVILRSPTMQKSVVSGAAMLTKDRERLWIDAGVLRTFPSTGKGKAHQTTNELCTCQDAGFRSEHHGGFCKHRAVFAILSLAAAGVADIQSLMDHLIEDELALEQHQLHPDTDRIAMLHSWHSTDRETPETLDDAIFAAIDAGDFDRALHLAEQHPDPQGVALFISERMELELETPVPLTS